MDFSDLMIMTDLDGTFFGTRVKLVERNMKAVEYFKAHGGRFTLATGRMHCNMNKPLPMIRTLCNAPIIACNGALLYDMRTGETIAERLMDPEITEPVVFWAADNYPDVGVRISMPRGFLTDAGTVARIPQIAHDISTCNDDGYMILEREKWRDYPWYKVVIRGASDRLDALREELEKKYPGRFETSKSGATFFELQSIGTTKAVLLPELRAYCEREAGKPLTIYACGDFENDLTMLRAADVAACPSNSIDAVKAISDLCLCSNDEGFTADLINHMIAERGGDVRF